MVGLMHREAGNVLFIILIATILFGALSFAVGNMLRGGDTIAIGQEKAGLYAAEILDKARQIRSGVQEARAAYGCLANDMSFANDRVSGYAHTPATDIECQIFHASYGGTHYSVPPVDWLDTTQSAQTGYGQWFFTGESCVYDVGTGSTDCATASGSADSDLIAVMPWIKREICIAINDALGLTGANDDPPQAAGTSWNAAFNKFTGTYSQGGDIQSDTSGTAVLTGITAGCFEGGTAPPAGSYHFYQVLMAR